MLRGWGRNESWHPWWLIFWFWASAWTDTTEVARAKTERCTLSSPQISWRHRPTRPWMQLCVAARPPKNNSMSCGQIGHYALGLNIIIIIPIFWLPIVVLRSYLSLTLRSGISILTRQCHEKDTILGHRSSEVQDRHIGTHKRASFLSNSQGAHWC
jgi:hypothetical protein